LKVIKINSGEPIDLLVSKGNKVYLEYKNPYNSDFTFIMNIDYGFGVMYASIHKNTEYIKNDLPSKDNNILEVKDDAVLN
jgi:hypothetical protein